MVAAGHKLSGCQPQSPRFCSCSARGHFLFQLDHDHSRPPPPLHQELSGGWGLTQSSKRCPDGCPLPPAHTVGPSGQALFPPTDLGLPAHECVCVCVYGQGKVEGIKHQGPGVNLAETEASRANFLPRQSRHFPSAPDPRPYLGMFPARPWLLAPSHNACHSTQCTPSPRLLALAFPLRTRGCQHFLFHQPPAAPEAASPCCTRQGAGVS